MKISKKLALCAALTCSAWASTSIAATEGDKLAAIQAGLNRLASIQQVDGRWEYGDDGYDRAATGASLLAFMTQKDKWGTNAADYKTAADKAVSYLLSIATKVTNLSTRNTGANICPGGIGTCDGVYWGGGHEVYTTGHVIPGLVEYVKGFGIPLTDVATISGPLAGMTWAQIFQANVNQWAAMQTTSGSFRGGWRYNLSGPAGDADSSTTQWGTISLIYAESVGATTPAIVKTELDKWLLAVQTASGNSCYFPLDQGQYYCDHANTGSNLLGLKYLGKLSTDPRVVKAINWLNTNWQDTANNGWFGNFNHPYAMFAVYKGLEVNIGLNNKTAILNLRPNMCFGGANAAVPGNSGTDGYPGNPANIANCNWWQDYNDWLVDSQQGTGNWPGYDYWNNTLATAYHIVILGAAVVPVARCDVNGDQSTDTLDLSLISKARGKAVPPNDVYDTNQDGSITPADVKFCIPKCTLANCKAPPQPNP